jgi:hypothetical protein
MGTEQRAPQTAPDDSPQGAGAVSQPTGGIIMARTQLHDQIDRCNSVLNSGLHLKLVENAGADRNTTALTLNDDHGQVRILALGTRREIALTVDGIYVGLDIVGRF